MIGIYANLMTRSKSLRFFAVAKQAGWKTLVGGPSRALTLRNISAQARTSSLSAKES